MGQETRRKFMKDCSTSAAAIVTLSGTAAPGEQPAREVEGTPYLCITCGTQFAETAQPPAHCPICEDERQYVNPDGQKWTTLEELRATHKNVIKQEEPGLYSINTEPKFGIGQRAFLIQTKKETSSGIASGSLDARRSRGLTSWAGSPRSRSRTRITTRRWWSGAAPSAAPRSTCTRPSGPG